MDKTVDSINKKHIAPLWIFLAGFVVIEIYRLINPKVFNMDAGEVTSYFYGALVLIWGLSIKHRVLQRNVRTLLIVGGVLTWSLFPIRLCK